MCEVFGGGSPVSVLEKSSWILVVVLVKKKRKRKRNCWWLFGWRKWKCLLVMVGWSFHHCRSSDDHALEDKEEQINYFGKFPV